jgi:hypothetical protein
MGTKKGECDWSIEMTRRIEGYEIREVGRGQIS